jgi:hypothetical protein
VTNIRLNKKKGKYPFELCHFDHRKIKVKLIDDNNQEKKRKHYLMSHQFSSLTILYSEQIISSMKYFLLDSFNLCFI